MAQACDGDKYIKLVEFLFHTPLTGSAMYIEQGAKGVLLLGNSMLEKSF